MKQLDKMKRESSKSYFAINIILWYAFTLLSTIFSKKYLNQVHDAYTLTLVALFYAAILKVLRASGIHDLVGLLTNYEYFCLGVFNIGTILLTNIGINETSVSLTYMVKATEPLFVLLLSYQILEESQPLKVRLTLIPICLGVTLIVYGEISLNLTGFLCAFSANLSSASRSVFIKSKLKESDSASDGTSKSAFTTYLNIGFVSLCLYVPIYVLNMFIHSETDFIRSFTTAFDYLLYGSLFSFLYNLFSLNVLSNVATISHSIINIMKRVFIVFFSMIVFSTRITLIQWCGMICADFGVFLYSMLKMRSRVIQVSISTERKTLFKRFCVYFVVLILFGSCFFVGSNLNSARNITVKNYTESNRISCIRQIKENIISVAKNLIPADRKAHLIDIPIHDNYGDTLIWLGEEQLFIEMDIEISNRLVAYDKNLLSKDYLKSKISPEDTILLHGGGNFGDLYRYHTEMRNFIISTFPNNRIVILPQSINYRNESLAMNDNLVYSNATDLTIMARNFDSFETSKNLFPDVKTVFIPDAAFMIGDVKPLKPPIVDILVIRRIDNERRFDLDSWEGLIRKQVGNKYTFLVRDWTDYEDVKYKTLKQLASRRLDLTNKIISQGRVIISDRLHASVMSVLMGKPHVIINEKYKKIYYTRESAFYGIDQCSPDDLRGYYANSIEDAIITAIKLLNELKQ